MTRLILMSVLCLTACGRPEPVIPEALTEPVIVTCPPGYTSGALGACLIALREGLNIANDRLAAVRGLAG